jgi:hypothetical protein
VICHWFSPADEWPIYRRLYRPGSLEKNPTNTALTSMKYFETKNRTVKMRHSGYLSDKVRYGMLSFALWILTMIVLRLDMKTWRRWLYGSDTEAAPCSVCQTKRLEDMHWMDRRVEMCIGVAGHESKDTVVQNNK